MEKKTSRQAIQKRISKALQCMEEGDPGEAIFNIAPAIDVIAKERHKDKNKVGDRIKAFIFDEQHLIYYLSTQGKLSLSDGSRIVLVDSNTDKPIGGVKGSWRTSFIIILDVLKHMMRILIMIL